MTLFDYRQDELFAEQVPLSKIAAEFGTPTYVYSRAGIENELRSYQRVLAGHSHLICYAVKSNSNLAVLDVLARAGAGFDIVSGGELERVLRAGGSAAKTIFSGVGKSTAEIEKALLAGIACFNIESEAELERICMVAERLQKVAPVSLRVNPDVDAGTHPYISTGLKENKFGIDSGQAFELYLRAAEMPQIKLIGIDCHIGSQLTELGPYMDAIDKMLTLVDRLQTAGIVLEHFDIGGGLGVCYRDEQPPAPQQLISAVLKKLGRRKLKLMLEPGRSITANAGILLTRVEYLKHTPHKNFAIVDAGMNDLIRPALYGAWQNIIPVRRGSAESQLYDVVGPVCESADFLGKERSLAILPDDLLAVMSAGSYGFVMSSNYNSRNRAAEVLVDGPRMHLVRQRESLEQQLQLESCLPE
ncbi:MAG: diaminopimelate decarboxylase [Pseudohongiellaceae bacterium]